MQRRSIAEIFKLVTLVMIFGMLWAPWALADSVDGRVADEQGQALAGARVELWQTEDYDRALRDPAASDPGPVAVARTGADGVFRLSLPEPGRWTAVARHEGRLSATCALGFLATDAQLPQAHLPLPTERRILVVNTDGLPAPGARVAVTGWRGDPRHGARFTWQPDARAAWAGADGRAVVPAASDENLTILATADSGFGYARSNAGSTDVVETKLTGTWVEARWTDAEGKPTPGIAVTFFPTVPALNAGPRGEMRVPYQPGQGTLMLSVANETGILGGVRASGQSPLSLQVPAPPTVNGRVLDGSGKPVAGAWVWSHGVWHKSNEQGAYSLRVPTGISTLGVSAPGFAESLVELPQSSADLDIVLEPAAALAGRVVDAQGQSLAHVEVTAVPDSRSPKLLPLRHTMKLHLLPRELTARSDRDGRFRVEGMVPEVTYHLTLDRAGFSRGLSAVAPIQVGENRFVDIELRPGISLSGRIVDGQQRPVAGARIELIPEQPPRQTLWAQGPTEPYGALSGKHGHFELADVAAGLFTLKVEADGFAHLVRRGVEPAAGDSVLELGELILDRGARVWGRVLDEHGQGIEGAHLAVTSADRTATGSSVTATTEADGRFVARGAPSGRLNISAWARGYKSARLENITVDVEQPLDLRLETSLGLQGRVVDAEGHGVVGAEVRLQASAKSGWSTARTDSEGNFAFSNVSAGRVQLSVRHAAGAVGPVEWQIPGSEARLVLAPTASVQGRLSNTQGDAVAGADIYVRREPPSEDGSPVVAPGANRTGADGRFLLQGLDDGTYRVHARHPDFEPVSGILTVAGGEGPALELVAQRTNPITLKISGLVLDGAANPVSGAVVHLVRPGEVDSQWRVPTFDDGRFELQAPNDGFWQLLAHHPALASRRSASFELGESPADEMRLVMETGYSVRGRIAGLQPRELAGVEVQADSRSYGRRSTRVDADGTYELSHLAAGTWHITASPDTSPRSVTQTVTLPTDGEPSIDLRFDPAHVLKGSVLRHGTPLQGRSAKVLCSGFRSSAWTSILADGSFRFDGIPKGSCELEILEPNSLATLAQRRIEITGDTEIQVEVTAEP